MTRAEELAKAYEESLDYYHCMNDWPSTAYSAGYEQAEKDLALTWEDVQLLDFYAMECQVEEYHGRKFNSSQEFFEEVLRRFKAVKDLLVEQSTAS